jgi:hypothetical protein
MMDCTDVKKYLMDYSDGGLSPELENAIDEHAGHCGSCAGLLAGYKTLEAAISGQKSKAPLPFAATRILQRLENEADSHNRIALTVLRPVLITLALLVALMAGFLIGNAGYSRIVAPETGTSRVETLKSELFIHDFVDEDITLVANY